MADESLQSFTVEVGGNTFETQATSQKAAEKIVHAHLGTPAEVAPVAAPPKAPVAPPAKKK